MVTKEELKSELLLLKIGMFTILFLLGAVLSQV